jgi:hypothetical protein
LFAFQIRAPLPLVNAAIYLNHQPKFDAIEIDYELIDQVLPPELNPPAF